MIKNKKLAYILIGILIIIFLGLVFRIYKIYQESKSLTLITKQSNVKLSNYYKQTAINYYLQASKPTSEIQKMIDELNTPSKLINYLNNKNFQIIESDKTISLTPEEFIKLENGSQIAEIDYASFASLILEENDYYSVVFLYKFNDSNEESQHYVVPFRDGDTPRYLVYTNKGFEAFEAGWSFKDLCQIEEQRLNVKTNQYTSFIAGTVDFSNPLTWDNCH